MADLSKELKDFKSAIYGEDVRDGLISAITKINDEVDSALKDNPVFSIPSGNIAESARFEETDAVNGKLYFHCVGLSFYYNSGTIYKSWNTILSEIGKTAIVTDKLGWCIEIPNNNAFVYDMTEHKCKLIDRTQCTTYQIILFVNLYGRAENLHSTLLNAKIFKMDNTISSLADKLAETTNRINNIKDELTDFVKTVNGLHPDTNGNVTMPYGSSMTYSGSTEPYLYTYPASDWAPTEYSSHIGDLYFGVAGSAIEGIWYRFQYNNVTRQYSWARLKTDDIQAAIDNANAANLAAAEAVRNAAQALGTANTAASNAQSAVNAVNGSLAGADVEYYISSSKDLLVGGEWLTYVPSAYSGFIWTRTKFTNISGTSTYSQPVRLTGEKGNTGSTTYLHIKYSKYSNGAEMSDAADEFSSYIGIASSVNSTPSDNPQDYKWVLIKGADGTNGAPGESVTVTSTETYYANSESGTIMPNGDWSHIAEPYPGLYTWTKIVIKYSDGNDSTTFLVSYTAENGKSAYDLAREAGFKGSMTDWLESLEGNDGKSGTLIWIAQNVPSENYVFSISDLSNPVSTDGMSPRVGDFVFYGTYYYPIDRVTRTEVHASMRVLQGGDGAVVNSYIHFAYATNDQGENFSIEPFEGAIYLGICTNNIEADPVTWGSYSWTRIQGKDGSEIQTIKELYYLGSTMPEAPTSPVTSTSTTSDVWTTVTPKYIAGLNYYTCSEIYMDNGSVIWSGVTSANGLTLSNQVASDTKDQAESIQNTIDQTQESIAEVADRITNIENNITNTTITLESVNNLMEDYKSQMLSTVQTISEFTEKYGDYDRNIVDANGNIVALQENLASVSKYIREENGELVIGGVGSPFTLRLGNEKLSFYQGGTEITYFSNYNFAISNGTIWQSMRIGNFQWVPRSNGNMSLIYKGGL